MLRTGPPKVTARGLALLGLIFALAVAAFAQHVIDDRGTIAESWPLFSALDERLTDIYSVEQSVALAIPLFALAMVLFVYSLQKLIGDPPQPASDIESQPRQTAWPRSTVLRAALAIAALLALGGWAFLVWQLIANEYDPAFWWLFVGIGVVALGICFAIDRMRGANLLLTLRWHWWEAAFVIAVTGLFTGLMVHDLTNWRYAGIDDQGAFWLVARDMANGSEELNLFSQVGVFDYQPVLSSAYQAMVMRFAGTDVFGWKLASVLAVAASLPVFYWLTRTLLGVRPAVFATAIMGVSHLLFAYAHTGYNNIFPLFPTLLALALFFAARRSHSVALMFGSGIAAGFGFYTFYSGRTAIIILALAGLMIALGFLRWPDLRNSDWRALRGWAGDVVLPVGIGFVMVAALIFAADGWAVISEMGPQSVFRDGVNSSSLTIVAENVPRAFFGFSFQPRSKHFVSGSLMDESSAVLVLLGLAFAVYHIRHRNYRFLVVWFVMAMMVGGVLHLRAHQDLMTRFSYVLPAGAALAGVALDRVVAAAASFFSNRRLEPLLGIVCFALVIPAVLGFNAHRFWVETPDRLKTPPSAVALREAGTSQCDREGLRSIVFAQPFFVREMQEVFEYHGWGERRPTLVAYARFTPGYVEQISDSGVSCIMAAEPDLPESQEIVLQMNAFASASGAVLREEFDHSGRTGILVLEVPPGAAETRSESPNAP